MQNHKKTIIQQSIVVTLYLTALALICDSILFIATNQTLIIHLLAPITYMGAITLSITAGMLLHLYSLKDVTKCHN